MRFDYTGRPQSDGRMTCEICKLPMLGVGEPDYRRMDPATWLAKPFCDCPEVKKSSTEPRESAAFAQLAWREAERVVERWYDAEDCTVPLSALSRLTDAVACALRDEHARARQNGDTKP